MNGPCFICLTREEMGMLSLSCVEHRGTPAPAFSPPDSIEVLLRPQKPGCLSLQKAEYGSLT